MAKTTVRQLSALMEEMRAEGGGIDLLRRALEAALAALMEDEVSQLTGADHGERNPERTTRRNGYRKRTLHTGLGSSVLEIPKLRQGSYLPSFLQAHQRSDEALVMAVATCYQQGVSTRNVAAIGQALGVESLSSSTVSRMAQALDPQIQAFRDRPLGEFPYVFVDARYEFVRENHRVEKMALLIAIGVRHDGPREVLGFSVARVENEAYWSDFLRELKARGLTGVRLLVSDAHEGLKAAIARVFPEARWQRCKVHFLRNLGQRIPRKKRPALVALAKTIFEQESAQDARNQRALVVEIFHRAGMTEAATFLERSDEVLSYLEMPSEHWTKLHSTNALERLNREIKRRTRVVSIFPHRASLERLAGALLLEEHEEWTVARRYISESSMQKLKEPEEQLEELAPGAAALLAADHQRKQQEPTIQP